MRSYTAVYGARGQNPNFLTEDHWPEPNQSLGWVRDKLEAEQHVLAFAKRYPSMGVSILRFATILGSGLHTFYGRILAKRVGPGLLCYDPLVQFLHPEDALAALEAALAKGPCGIVNVVPRDTLSLLTALHLSEKVTVAVPHPVAYALADLAWNSG